MTSPLLNQITRVPVDAITPHPDNARRGNTEAIKESLERNQQFAPIVVQKSTGYVLSGNHTLKAARELGWTEIAAVYVDVDDIHARRVMLAANRTADLGGYDDDAIVSLLSYLEGDYEGTGYTKEDLDALLAVQTPPDLSMFKSFDDLDDAPTGTEPHTVTCPACGHAWFSGGTPT